MIEVITNSFDAWVKASRPKTLGAMFCPVALGSAVAYGHGYFMPMIMATTLMCAILLQIMANVVNDYCDFIKGGDSKERLGPPRAMQMGWITEPVMQKGMGLILLTIIFLGLSLVFRGGIPILILGISAITVCIWYTAGPKPLSYLGFSELVVMLFFGPLPVFGSYFLQSLHLCIELIPVSMAPACLSAALMLTNNLRDVEEDKKNNKRTMAVRFGIRFSRLALVGLVLCSLMTPVILIACFNYSPWIMISAAAIVPAAIRFPIIGQENISPRFNLMLAGVGQSLYCLAIVLSIGLIYGAP